MTVAFEGQSYSQSQQPWVGDKIKLQKLSGTVGKDYPKKDKTFIVNVKIESATPDGKVKFWINGSDMTY